ncbi:Uncharacterised protein [Yersinia frederiksenii]|nr:Uncharacterised protein [Yersinia frederiksenii]
MQRQYLNVCVWPHGDKGKIMSKTITVKMARPSADEVKSLYKLFHATEAAEDRWNRESSEQFLERLDDQDISDEERAFIAVAWDSLVQGHGGFGRFMGAYDTLIYNFQDPDADHVAIHPKFNDLFTESELLPVVLESYADARNTVAELENERDAALNACDLIAEALGITGAVSGDTIARVQQLVAELEAAQFEIKELTRRLETPVPLPKSAYFKNSAENIPFFRAFAVIEAIHKAGFRTVTYED